MNELRKIAEAATPGPWRHGCLPGINRRDNRVIGPDWDTVLDCDDMAFEDALHIATFDPELVGALLDVAESAQHHHPCDENCLPVSLREALDRLAALTWRP